MRKGIQIILAIISLIAINSVTALITVSPSSWSGDYSIGETNTLQQNFEFSNSKNNSVLVALDIIGDRPSYFSLSSSSVDIPALSSESVTVLTNVPNNAIEEIVLNNLQWSAGVENGEIPLVLKLIDNSNIQQECRINPSITHFIQRITRGTNPFTRTFTVSVSNNCEAPVILNEVIISGTVQTSDGEKPIRLAGALSLGEKNPGEQSQFGVEFDVEGIEIGSYNPTATIVGNYQGNQISTKIQYTIEVLEGVTPITDITTLPEYIIPDSVTAGQTFEIIGRNVNINLQPSILPNEKLIGESVSNDASGNWIWKGKTNDTSGSITIKIATLFKGNQIDRIISKEVDIIGSSSIPGSDVMKFEFFPQLSSLVDGNNVTVTARDTGNNNLIQGWSLFVNGLASETTFPVEANKNLTLTATHPNYNTLDYIIFINPGFIPISILPSKTVNTNTLINFNSTEDGIKYFVNGLELDGSSYLADKKGVFTLKAIKDGFLDTSINFTVQKIITLTNFPPQNEKLKKGDSVILELSEPTEWIVFFQETYKEGETIPPAEQIATGSQQVVEFVLNDAGKYHVESDGKILWSYTIENFDFGKLIKDSYKKLWFWVVAIVIIVVVFFVVKNANKKRDLTIKQPDGPSIELGGR